MSKTVLNLIFSIPSPSMNDNLTPYKASCGEYVFCLLAANAVFCMLFLQYDCVLYMYIVYNKTGNMPIFVQGGSAVLRLMDFTLFLLPKNLRIVLLMCRLIGCHMVVCNSLCLELLCAKQIASS